MYAVIFVKPYTTFFRALIRIVADHIGLLPYDSCAYYCLFRITFVHIIAVFPAAGSLCARVGIKHDLVIVGQHEAVGRSGKHTVVTLLRVKLQCYIVVVVASHVVVIIVVGAEIDRIEKVRAIGLRRDKQLNIQRFLRGSVVLKFRIGILADTAAIGGHIECVDLARGKFLVDRHRAGSEILVVGTGVVLLNRSLLHAHLLWHVVDDHTCYDKIFGFCRRHILETDLGHHACKVYVDRQ